MTSSELSPVEGVTAKVSKSRKSGQNAQVAADRPASSRSRGLHANLLKVAGLTKRYDETTAVVDLDLTLPAGSICGIVGPNGAGKSTTLLMMAGLLRPDEGSVIVADEEVWQAESTVRASIGVMPDRMRLFDRLTGGQLLHYSAVLHGLSSAEAARRTSELIDAFNLADAATRLVADYSKGMAKKIALATAMVHNPKLLVLDEPFESVDPVSVSTLTEILQNYVAGGGTVVFSSHAIDYVERVCDRVVILIDGVARSKGTMKQVSAGKSLQARLITLIGESESAEGLEWLRPSSA